MGGLERSSRRFLMQNILPFLLMEVFAFDGVFASGRNAYQSANELGAMTADYLNLQVDAFMGQYQQILEDAAYMVDAMLEQGATAEEIQRWITTFSQQYEETMQYDESGIYGVIHGEGYTAAAGGPARSTTFWSGPGISRLLPPVDCAPAPWCTRTPAPAPTW